MPRLRLHFRRTASPAYPDPSVHGFLSCSYSVRRGQKTTVASWDGNNKEAVDQMKGVLSRFVEGSLAVHDVEWMAPTLRNFLGYGDSFSKPSALNAHGETVSIELSADAEVAAVLANVPWEMASLADGPLPKEP